MPVTGYAVGLEVVGSLGEQRGHLGLAPGTGNPRFRVGDQAILVDEPGRQERCKAELHGGRVAAWISDQARRTNRLAIHLRQAIDRLFDPVRTGMLHSVPFLPHGNVLDAIVSREVDDANPGVE